MTQRAGISKARVGGVSQGLLSLAGTEPLSNSQQDCAAGTTTLRLRLRDR